MASKKKGTTVISFAGDFSKVIAESKQFFKTFNKDSDNAAAHLEAQIKKIDRALRQGRTRIMERAGVDRTSDLRGSDKGAYTRLKNEASHARGEVRGLAADFVHVGNAADSAANKIGNDGVKGVKRVRKEVKGLKDDLNNLEKSTNTRDPEGKRPIFGLEARKGQSGKAAGRRQQRLNDQSTVDGNFEYRAGQGAFQFARVIEDSPYGMIGIANNIPMAAIAWREIKDAQAEMIAKGGEFAKAAGMRNMFKMMMTGPYGLMMYSAIITSLIIGMPKLIKMMRSLKTGGVDVKGLATESKIQSAGSGFASGGVSTGDIQRQVKWLEDKLKESKATISSIKAEVQSGSLGTPNANTQALSDIISDVQDRKARLESAKTEKKAFTAALENKAKELGKKEGEDLVDFIAAKAAEVETQLQREHSKTMGGLMGQRNSLRGMFGQQSLSMITAQAAFDFEARKSELEQQMAVLSEMESDEAKAQYNLLEQMLIEHEANKENIIKAKQQEELDRRKAHNRAVEDLYRDSENRILRAQIQTTDVKRQVAQAAFDDQMTEINRQIEDVRTRQGLSDDERKELIAGYNETRLAAMAEFVRGTDDIEKEHRAKMREYADAYASAQSDITKSLIQTTDTRRKLAKDSFDQQNLAIDRDVEDFEGTDEQRAEFDRGVTARRAANLAGYNAELRDIKKEELRILRDHARAVESADIGLAGIGYMSFPSRQRLLNMQKQQELRALDDRLADFEGTEEQRLSFQKQIAAERVLVERKAAAELEKLYDEQAQRLYKRIQEAAEFSATMAGFERASDERALARSTRGANSGRRGILGLLGGAQGREMTQGQAAAQRLLAFTSAQASEIDSFQSQFAGDDAEANRRRMRGNEEDLAWLEDYYIRRERAYKIHLERMKSLREEYEDKDSDAEDDFRVEKMEAIRGLFLEASQAGQDYLKASAQMQHDRRRRELADEGKTQQEINKIIAKEGNKRFQLYKALAIAETIVSTYSAAQKTYDSLSKFGPIVAGAGAAVAVASGLARVAQIRAQKIGGGYSGGGSSSGGGDVLGAVQVSTGGSSALGASQRVAQQSKQIGLSSTAVGNFSTASQMAAIRSENQTILNTLAERPIEVVISANDQRTIVSQGTELRERRSR